MATVLVSGSTGLLGGNVCQLLRSSGVSVRALVRDPDAASALAALGAELIPGDVTAPASLQAAAAGCDAIVHAAGLLGGAGQDLARQLEVNEAGSANVFQVAADSKCRVVHVSTLAVLDQSTTVTEASSIEFASRDPYSRTKRAAHLEALRRAEAGEDVVVVVPGSIYGPGLSVSQALRPTSFNRLLRGAINGRLARYPRTSSVWEYADDAARTVVGALTHGRAGEVFLAVGADDALPSTDFFNLACELAGVDHRVQPLVIDTTAPDAVATYGESIISSLSRPRATPAVDASWTQRRLSLSPVTARAGLASTVAWLASNNQITGGSSHAR
jgi:dihydroflavonol-4-reductase